MTTVKEIEQAVARLSERELAIFREWFEEFDAQLWDEQFEEDVEAGRLDYLAERAIRDYQAGKYKEL